MESVRGAIDTRNIVSACTNGGVLDRALVREILGYFIDENRRRVVQCREALAAGNRQTLWETAHALRGSAAMIGAGHLHDLAWAIELDAYSTDLRELATAVARVEAELTAVVAALQAAHADAWSG